MRRTSIAIVILLLALVAPPTTASGVPAPDAAPNPFGESTSACSEYECSWTIDGEDYCMGQGDEVPALPGGACRGVCECDSGGNCAMVPVCG